MPDIRPILDSIAQAPGKRALWNVMRDYVRGHGVKMASYHAVNSASEPIAVATDGFPEDWVRQYVAEDLVKIDPIPELAARMARPFYWHEVGDLMELSPENEAYLRRMTAAGLGDGLAFYVFGPSLQNAYVGLGFGMPHVVLEPGLVFELQCVSQAAHLRFCALDAERSQRPRLTVREREVLRWVAQGKSNSVIAEIMGVSTHTVDAHMRGVYRKLGVHDRTSAAVRGLGSGVLQYPR